MEIHRPPHVYVNDTFYIISASTLRKLPYLDTKEEKKMFLTTLNQVVEDLNFELSAWVILNNHYHILLRIRSGKDLSKFIQLLHGKTSFNLNRMSNQKAKIWYNYWDTCIRTENDFWIRFNYIHNNPVKHGYSKIYQDYEFSSYRFYLATKGEEWLEDIWRTYPVIDFLEGDDFESSKAH